MMEDDRIAKRVYVRECLGSYSVGCLWKSWIDSVKYYLKKKVWMLDKQGKCCIIGMNCGFVNP